jgi:hypothetical protein
MNTDPDSENTDLIFESGSATPVKITWIRFRIWFRNACHLLRSGRSGERAANARVRRYRHVRQMRTGEQCEFRNLFVSQILEDYMTSLLF